MSSFNKKFYRLYPILIIVFILSGCCAIGELKHDDLCIPDCREFKERTQERGGENERDYFLGGDWTGKGFE